MARHATLRYRLETAGSNSSAYSVSCTNLAQHLRAAGTCLCMCLSACVPACRASPWPDVTQIRRELLEQDSSTSSSIQHGSPTTSTTAAAAAATAAAAAAAPATNGSLTARSAPVVPVAAAGLRASGNGAAAAAVANADFGDMAGSGGSSMQASPAEYEGDSLNSVYDGLGGLEGELLGEENERSRAIAEQLAQLHVSRTRRSHPPSCAAASWAVRWQQSAPDQNQHSSMYEFDCNQLSHLCGLLANVCKALTYCLFTHAEAGAGLEMCCMRSVTAEVAAVPN